MESVILQSQQTQLKCSRQSSSLLTTLGPCFGWKALWRVQHLQQSQLLGVQPRTGLSQSQYQCQYQPHEEEECVCSERGLLPQDT